MRWRTPPFALPLPPVRQDELGRCVCYPVEMATKRMALRRDDHCTVCSTSLPAGTKAQWDSAAKAVTCLACAEATPSARPSTETVDASGEQAQPAAADPAEARPVEIEAGTPGASARAERRRRQAKREQQIEQKWGTGRIGKVAKFLSDDPQTTRAWEEGAKGEERVAKILHEHLSDRAVLLHDRKVPRTRGNIDHLAIAPSGVWIIDAKKYKGKVEKRDVGACSVPTFVSTSEAETEPRLLPGWDGKRRPSVPLSAPTRSRSTARSASSEQSGRCSSPSPSS